MSEAWLGLKQAYWRLRGRVWRPLLHRVRRRREVGLSAERWRQADVVSVRGLPHPIHLRPGTTDLAVFEEVFFDRAYPLPSWDVRTVVDCGANAGFVTLWFLRAYPGARVVAIEPDPENWALARKNLEPYGDRVTLLRAAVWPASQHLALIRDRHAGAFDSVRVAAIDGAAPDDTVEALTIPDVMRRAGMSTVDLLKIDIEGAEGPLLRGDTSFLDATRTLMIELHDEECRDAFRSAIASRNFRITHRNNTTIADRPQ